MVKQLLQEAILERKATGEKIKASIPGDITIDLFNAGKIKNPYVGMNHHDLQWIIKEDFTYTVQFDVDEELLKEEEIFLVFEGIDLFSEIYLNGTFLGKTENMFLRYSFNVKNVVLPQNNILQVKMISTLAEMDKINTQNYFGTFNVPRIFLRKIQCHFGWDWAPVLCGYGIWEKVYLLGEKSTRINDATYVADNQGRVTLLAELNYNVCPTCDNMGVPIEGTAFEKKEDKLFFYLEKEPYTGDFECKEVQVKGKKNFVNFFVKNPQLWWPVGYGAQPLYKYRIELERAGEIVSVKTGKMAFREVKILEEPKTDCFIGYSLHINGTEIFVKGSNWVPAEVFTGTIKDKKYERLIQLAKDGNLNMLRVWGGGLYEKDIFLELCDEMGIMVWQDFMFACSDIPETNEQWVKNIKAECEYQIRRLRNHPSLVYWSGGNEKTGTCVLQRGEGDDFVDYLLQGLVKTFDKTRPYARQSPCSWTDIGNNYTSGDCHCSSGEIVLERSMREYRELVASNVMPFLSECAVLGPNSIETNKKIYGEEKLWPLNEVWDDRLMDNPYSGISMRFLERQKFYIDELYGEAKNIDDFTAKGMLAHAEMLRCEEEFARSNKGLTWGVMNWMYSDIWPSGTWSIIDYYLEPKQAYYQTKRTFAPILVTFVQNARKETELVVVNDTLTEFVAEIVFGQKTISGEIIFEQKIPVNVSANGLFKMPIKVPANEKQTYLFAQYQMDGETQKTVYSPTFWSDCTFDSDYQTNIKQLTPTLAQVEIKAKAFAKSVFIHMKDNYKYTYSDNYFDVEAGDTKIVTVACDEAFDSLELEVTDYAKMTR